MQLELQLPWGDYNTEEKNFLAKLEADKVEATVGSEMERQVYPGTRRSTREPKNKERINGIVCSVNYYNRGMIYNDHYATFADIAWMRY